MFTSFLYHFSELKRGVDGHIIHHGKGFVNRFLKKSFKKFLGQKTQKNEVNVLTFNAICDIITKEANLTGQLCVFYISIYIT